MVMAGTQQALIMKKKSFLACFLFLFTVGLLLYLAAARLCSGVPTNMQTQLGFCIIASALFPTILYLRNLMIVRPVDPIPFLPLLGMIYAIYYGMPAISDEPLLFRLQSIPEDAMIKSYQVALAGWWALLAGFYIVGKLLRVKPFLFPLGNGIAAKKTTVCFLLIGLLSEIAQRFFHLPPSLGQLPLLLNNFLPLGLGILIILSLKGSFPKGSLFEISLWVLILPLFLFLKLSSGLIASVVFPLIFIFILFWIFSAKFHYIWVLVILLPLLILIKGSITEYRAVAWYGEKKGLSGFERSKLLMDITKKRILNEGLKDSFENSKKGVQERASQIVTLMRVIDQTPQYIPYWNGETYRTILYTFIPRILWPSKPVKDLGQRFGHRYGFLDAKDTTTSINLPQLTEFYANFGTTGVLIGMMVIGVIYRWVYRKLNSPWSEEGTLLAGAFIFSNLTNIESDSSLIFCMVIYQLIALYFARRFIKS